MYPPPPLLLTPQKTNRAVRSFHLASGFFRKQLYFNDIKRTEKICAQTTLLKEKIANPNF